MMRIIGYGAILDVFVMIGLGWEPRGSLMPLLAVTPVFVGPAALLLLIVQPEATRREGWLIAVLVWMLLLGLVLPVLGVD
jgi:hypothetical protein